MLMNEPYKAGFVACNIATFTHIEQKQEIRMVALFTFYRHFHECETVSLFDTQYFARKSSSGMSIC